MVNGFNSVSAMFESTYYALHSSFRAVLSVVEQLTRVRAQFAHILSAFAAVRLVRRLYHRLLSLLLDIEPPENIGEQWDGGGGDGSFDVAGDRAAVNWPILLYTGLTVAAPYLTWKLVSSFASSEEEQGREQTRWARGEAEHFVAVAEFDFAADGDEEISFRAGDTVLVAPKHRQPRVRGWLLGSRDGQRIGLFPANYAKIVGKRTPETVGGGGTNQRPDIIANSVKESDMSDAFK